MIEIQMQIQMQMQNSSREVPSRASGLTQRREELITNYLLNFILQLRICKRINIISTTQTEKKHYIKNSTDRFTRRLNFSE